MILAIHNLLELYSGTALESSLYENDSFAKNMFLIDKLLIIRTVSVANKQFRYDFKDIWT